MTPETKTLCNRLLALYFVGRPHGNDCDCSHCEAWDAIEAVPESAFNGLSRELEADFDVLEAVKMTNDEATPSGGSASGIEALVCADIAKRQDIGLRKYGMTLENNPAKRLERLQHAYEESLDLPVYLRWEIEQTKR